MKKIIFYATEFDDKNNHIYKDYKARIYQTHEMEFAITHTESGYKPYEITTGLRLTNGYFGTLAEVKALIDRNVERIKPNILHFDESTEQNTAIMKERRERGYDKYTVLEQTDEPLKRMRIIKYRQDRQTAYLGYVECEYIGITANGVEIYREDTDDNGITLCYFYCKVSGVKMPLVDCVTHSYAYDELNSDVFTRIENLPQENVIAFTTADGKLKDIERRISEQKWTNNADALFCELCGNNVLAKQVCRNRTEYRQRQNEQDEKERAKRAERERIEKEQKAQQRAVELAQAEENLRNGKHIKSTDFEAICVKYGVKMSIKTLGWLREWCTDISFENYYYKRVNGNRKHTSNTIFDYMQQLKTAMCA